MAFPTVKARTETPDTTASTTVAFDFAANAAAGDLVVAFIGLNDTAQAITTTESFTNWTNASATFHVIYKILNGTEGTSSAVTVPVASRAAVIAYTITAGTFAPSITPAISTVATGTSTAPNATSCAPTGSAKDYLWISAFRQNGEEADDDTWTTAAPTTPGTFTNLIQVTTGTAGAATGHGSVASAEYQANATSVDAGAFTVAQSLAWRAYTIAIYPIQTGSLTANAIIKKTGLTGSLSADAVKQQTFTVATTTAAAIKQQTYTVATTTVDAEITVGTQTITVETTKADAVLLKTITDATRTIDAIKRLNVSDSIVADAIVQLIAEGSLTADAVRRASFDEQLFVDAIRRESMSGSITADAITFKTIDGLSFAVQSLIDGGTLVVEDSFATDAYLSSVGRCVWTSPPDGDPIDPTPELKFLMPPSRAEMYFWIELDKADTFDTADLRRYMTTTDLTGWSYWDGNSWEAITSAGVANTYAGNEARFTVSVPLTAGIWYRRVRAGTR